MKLLIIGNGFDKWCDLKSGFDDFVKERFREDINKVSSIDEIIKYFNTNKIEFTFIEKYMIITKYYKSYSELLWSDLEEILFQLVTKGENYIENIIGFLSKNIEIKNDINFFGESNVYLSTMATILNDHFNLFMRNERNMYFRHENSDIFDLLKKDLNKFENEFSSYLSWQISSAGIEHGYNDKAEKLKALLVGDSKYNVLNFNYTRPNTFYKIFSNRPSIINPENVHGDIHIIGQESNIIIGIDSTRIDHSDKAYSFTKTFRKVEMYTIKQDKLVNDILNDKYRYNEIIFFGHSLNKQDYAYFQTIFDKYDLYNSNIKLTFCYSLYDKTIEDKIKNNQINAVIQLIETYGKTFVGDNKFKGKNLLHRLLNTNRLSIKEIGTFEK